ncbi:MAG: hypothetical protein AB1656_13100 [Candidatus Omnitrophota bacterium]
MKTAEEIILEFKELPPEEWQKVVEYVEAAKENVFPITHYSPEDMADIEHDLEEAKRGENVVGPFTGEEANEYLRKLMRNA